MKLEKRFEKELEEIEKSKEGEKKSASQERQANILSLKEKAAKLKELSLAWQEQFGVAEEQIKEFKKADEDVTEVFDKYKGKGLIKEKTRQKFIEASRAGEYDEDSSGREADKDEEASEVEIRDQKMGEAREAIRPRTGVSLEEKSLTIAQLRKDIKKVLPKEVTKNIDFSLKSVNKENVGFTIERAVLGIEGEVKNLVKEGVIERHKNGSVNFSPDDLKDMETLSKEEMENIILEQANKLIETKRAKDFVEVESLEQDTLQMLSLEQRFADFKGDITKMARQLSYFALIHDLAQRFATLDQRVQVENKLNKIANDFIRALSDEAIIKALGEKPERTTEDTRNEIYRTIRGFDNKFADAINEKIIKRETVDNKKLAELVVTLEGELTTITDNIKAALQELAELPVEKKYMINPQAEELLDKDKRWKEARKYSSHGKNMWAYLNEKKANVNITANREKSLAEASLNENFLTLENRAAEKENGEVYNKVSEYYKKVKKLGEIAKQLEKAMGGYGSDFSVQKEEPFFIMTALDQKIKEWETSKQEDNEEISKQEKVIEKFSSWLSSKTHKKEIATANEIIKEKKEHIDGILDPEIAKFETIKKNAQAEFAKFFAAIPKEWSDNEKLSQGIFKKHESGSALGNIVFDLEHRPNDFGIISDNEVEIYKKLGWQRETLKKAAEDKKQAEESLSTAQTQAAKFAAEYLS